jgi:hypothetical protein
MSAERDAFLALELLSEAFPGEPWSLEPGEMFSPSKAQAGDYSARLKQGRQAHPPEGDDQQKAQPRNLTPQQKLSGLRKLAADLLEHQTPFPDRLPLLRARAERLGMTLRDQELQRLIWDARRAAAGTIEPLKPGDALNITACPWHWEGVVMAACLNMIAGLPKTGKTSLLLAWLAVWFQGEPSFLGMDLIGRCPPVLIVGTDQPENDWGRMLREVGLLTDQNQLAGPIVGLFHKGRPLHLDCEGIERIATYAAEHQPLLILLDSISACTSPLGLDENSAEIAEPINDLMEAVSPHGATVVMIHHSSKGRQGENPTMAVRGSTALAAVPSQLIALSRLASPAAGPPDRRVVLKTEGREGLPVQMLIERTEVGFISHGSAEAVAQAQALQLAEEELTDRQADALAIVRERWSKGQQRTDSKVLGEALQLGRDSDRKARSTLDQLRRRGLLAATVESGLQSRIKWFWPVGGEEASRGGLKSDSYPSEPSSPHQGPECQPLRESDRKEGSEGKEVEKRPPRETLRTPHAGRVPVRWNGAPGWSRSATARRGHGSVMLTSADGRHQLAGWDEIADESP